MEKFLERFLELSSQYEQYCKLGGLQMQTMIGIRKQQQACRAFQTLTGTKFISNNNNLCLNSNQVSIETIEPSILDSVGISILGTFPDLFPKLQNKQLEAIFKLNCDLNNSFDELYRILSQMQDLEKSILSKASSDKIGDPTEITPGLAYDWISRSIIGYKLDINHKLKIKNQSLDTKNIDELMEMHSMWINSDQIDLKLQVLISERLFLLKQFI